MLSLRFYFVFPCVCVHTRAGIHRAGCTHTQPHTHAHTHRWRGGGVALLEVHAKRLTLKVGLLISRISGRSKTTIKVRGAGGCCRGSEGSLASQHTDVAVKTGGRRSLITEEPLPGAGATRGLIGHQQREARERERESDRLDMQHLWWCVHARARAHTHTRRSKNTPAMFAGAAKENKSDFLSALRRFQLN